MCTWKMQRHNGIRNAAHGGVYEGSRMRICTAAGLSAAIALTVLLWPAQIASAQGRKPVTDAMRDQCRAQVRAAGLSGRFRPASQRTKRQILFLNCLAKLRKQ